LELEFSFRLVLPGFAAVIAAVTSSLRALGLV
jgi:hypothetical protein